MKKSINTITIPARLIGWNVLYEWLIVNIQMILCCQEKYNGYNNLSRQYNDYNTNLFLTELKG